MAGEPIDDGPENLLKPFENLGTKTSSTFDKALDDGIKAKQRQQDFIKEFTDAALNLSKTLTGQTPELFFEEISAGDGMRVSNQGYNTLGLPNRADISTEEGRAAARAHIDMDIAGKLFHDKQIHYENLPNTPLAFDIYDVLEKARCDALMSKKYKGVSSNIDANTRKYLREEARFEHVDLRAMSAMYMQLKNKISGSNEGEQFINAHNKAIDEISLEQKLSDFLKDLFNKGEGRLSVSDLLDKLMDSAEDQEEFAKKSAEISSILAERIIENYPENPPQDNQQNEDEQDEFELEDRDVDLQSGWMDERDGYNTEPPEIIDLENAYQDLRKSETANNQSSNDKKTPKMLSIDDLIDEEFNYKIYTTEFDRVLRVDQLITYASAEQLRAHMERSTKNYKPLINKLATRLQRRLMAMQMRSWDTDLEEGKINPARLARVVTSPDSPRAFREEKDAKFKDTAVTLLVDNSGSMRHQKITIAALCTEILAQSLERAGVKVEILGFTTTEYPMSKKKWINDASPRNVGRLDDLKHLIYKEFNEPYRRIKDNIPLMIDESILDQNHDGESLIWAHNRLIQRPEQRKILIVISDGTPWGGYMGDKIDLAKLLKRVCEHIEEKSPVELSAIGINTAVSMFYKNWTEISSAEQLGKALIDKLDELFESPSALKARARTQRKEKPLTPS